MNRKCGRAAWAVWPYSCGPCVAPGATVDPVDKTALYPDEHHPRKNQITDGIGK